MIQIYADGELTYDSRLDEYDLQGLRVSGGLNKGGTAEIIMPAGHPAYTRYIEFRTLVEIYRDGVKRFRGRALYPADDYVNTRTVTCEGELCFLQDGVSRPYRYEDTPEATFKAVVGEYNAQVEPFKQFKIGRVTVTAPIGDAPLESEEAESSLDTVNKLLERCGGYIVFTDDDTGAREINWLATVGNDNQQTIEAGENLFDFGRTGANTDMATALIPYGAKDESTGKRLTIESVNGGIDYIKDADAAAIRGTITKPVIWDDITDPEVLLQQARQYLNGAKLLVTSLTISALDLSYIDKSIESFKLGDVIRVVSSAHGVNEGFQMVEYTEDLLNPAGSYITLGKEIRTLTSLDVAGDSRSRRELQTAVSAVKSDFKASDQQTANETAAMVEQSATIIRQEASQTYVTKTELEPYATKKELESYATGSALTEVETAYKVEIARLEARIAALEAAN